jgi:hypothetical protein
VPLTSKDIDEAVDAVSRDVTSTLGNDGELLGGIRREADLVVSFIDDRHGFMERLASGVRQWLHDTFRDTTWPACPRHRVHPLWLDEVDDPLVWRCPRDGTAVAPLGGLG